MLVGYYQFTPEFGKPEANLEKIEKALNECTADLIVLPELCLTGYQFLSSEELKGLSECAPDGPSCRQIQRIAKATNTNIVFGVAEKDGDRLFNSSVLLGPDGFIGKYRKIHLFFEETQIFDPGEELPEVYNINGMNVGMLICFDWVFPELFRILAFEGADLIVQPANLVLPYCQDAMRIRSIENRVFTITSNRTGSEERGGKDRLDFTGLSQVTGPKGEVLKSYGKESEEMKTIKIDYALARDKNITEYNNLKTARQPNLYRRSDKY